MADRTYTHRAWHAARRAVLERDQFRCQIGGPRCTGDATEVDHIVPWRLGGARYDPENLRAACKTCNVGRSNRSKAEGWRTADTRIVLVWGPPEVNKTQFVLERAQAGDLIVDYDLLAAALIAGPRPAGVQDMVLAARNAVLRQIRRGESGASRVWIVSSSERARERFPCHESVHVGGEGRHDVVRVDPHDQRELAGRFGEIDRAYRRESSEPSRSW